MQYTYPTPEQDAAADARVAANEAAMAEDDAELARIHARVTEPVRSAADARKLAENDHRVRMVLANIPRQASTVWHKPGSTGYMVQQLRTAALTLVELYRLGYRVGWDGLKAFVFLSTNPEGLAFVVNAHSAEAAHLLAVDAITSDLAWPER